MRGEKFMTDKQKKTAYAMLIDGFSLKEVSEATRSDEAVIRKEFGMVFPELKKRRNMNSGIFPNLENWMRENKVSNKDLASVVEVTPGCMSHLRRGETDIMKRYIDRILAVTGMTYEECFAKEKAPEEAATSIKG